MKLRNLLFGTMIACAFVACSNDDDPTPNPTPEGKGVGTLIAGIDSKSLTKAVTNSEEIKTLTVALYNTSTGVFVQSATLAANAPTEVDAPNDVKFAEVPAGIQYTIMAFANMPDNFNPEQTLSEVVATPIALADDAYDNGGYPMSSNGSEKVTLTADMTTFYGYSQAEFDDATIQSKVLVAVDSPVKLYRNVAKVNLMNITLNVPANEKYTSGNAKIEFDKAIILNAANQSLVADVTSSYAQNNWGNIQSLSATPYNAGDWFKVNADGSTSLVDRINKPDFITAQNAADYTTVNYSKTLSSISLSQDALGTGVSAQSEVTTPLVSFYVFENHKSQVKPTLLTLKGKYEFSAVGKGNETYKDVRDNAYYSLKVGMDGIAKGVLSDGVHRNVQYNISVTLKDNGALDPTGPDPDTTDGGLFVKTTIVEWGTVDQNVDIE